MVSKESLLYLGSFLCDNGSIGPELNRRRKGRNLKHCAVSGTTLFSLRQRRSELLKLAYFRNYCIMCGTTFGQINCCSWTRWIDSQC